MRGRVVAPDGTAIGYDWLPGDRPVLLIHGFATTAELTWGASGVVRMLADAGRGVLAVDLRGHGDSGKPHEAARYSPEIMADDLVAVLDGVGLDRVDVVGYSLGSPVAWALAVFHPNRVGRLVLGGIGTRNMFQVWGLEAVRGLLIDGRPMPDETATRLLTVAMTLPGTDPQALLALVEGMTGAIRGPSPVPTLVVAGGADQIASDAEALAAEIGGRFVSIPARTHLNLLSARAFKAAVADFLG